MLRLWTKIIHPYIYQAWDFSSFELAPQGNPYYWWCESITYCNTMYPPPISTTICSTAFQFFFNFFNGNSVWQYQLLKVPAFCLSRQELYLGFQYNKEWSGEALFSVRNLYIQYTFPKSRSCLLAYACSFVVMGWSLILGFALSSCLRYYDPSLIVWVYY